MRNWMMVGIVFIGLAMSVGAGPATTKAVNAGATTRAFEVSGHGALVLEVPKGWGVTVKEPPMPNGPGTVVMKSAGPKGTELLITTFWSLKNEAGYNSSAKLRKLIDSRAAEMRGGSKEGVIEVKEIKGDHATGWYFTVTDKSPTPGSFECMTGAVAGVGDLLLHVTVFHHVKDAPEVATAVGVLMSATQLAVPRAPGAVATTQGAAKEWRIASPDNSWHLVLPAGKLEVVEDQTNAGKTARRISAVDRESGLIVSVFMEPAAKRGEDAKGVRDYYWSKLKASPVQKKELVFSEVGEFATLQYDSPVGGGVMQRSLNLYANHGEVWVDVHVSKTGVRDGDVTGMEGFVRGVKVGE